MFFSYFDRLLFVYHLVCKNIDDSLKIWKYKKDIVKTRLKMDSNTSLYSLFEFRIFSFIKVE